MILVGLDLEATGLNKVDDRPIEVGLTLWSTKLNRVIESRTLLVQSDGVPITDEITEITGITQPLVDKFGWSPDQALDIVLNEFVDHADAIVAFNGRRFDIPMMQAWARRHGLTFPNKLVIDPFDGDLPGARPQELITMCAKNGIYYDAHEAGADVSAMMKLLSKYPLETVLERAQSPVVVVQSLQGRNENEKVKNHRFRWNPDMKIWWKKLKELDLEDLEKKVNNDFSFRVRPDLTPDMLETND